jgi:hypothetical protein
MKSQTEKLINYFGATLKRINGWKESADTIVANNGRCDGVQCENCCCFNEAAVCIAAPYWPISNRVDDPVAFNLAKVFLGVYEKASTID